MNLGGEGRERKIVAVGGGITAIASPVATNKGRGEWAEEIISTFPCDSARGREVERPVPEPGESQ